MQKWTCATKIWISEYVFLQKYKFQLSFAECISNDKDKRYYCFKLWWFKYLDIYIKVCVIAETIHTKTSKMCTMSKEPAACYYHLHKSLEMVEMVSVAGVF